MGGTKVAVGLISGGKYARLAELPTTPRDGDANLKAIRTLLSRAERDDVEAIGISLATTLDQRGRARDQTGRFGLTGVDITAELAGDRPISVLHDAVAGARGEYALGAGRGASRMAFVTLGTGLSHCILQAGEPVLGAHNSAFMSGQSVAARCPWPACTPRTVEDICSGPAIASDYLDSSVATDARVVVERARAGEDRARDVIQHASWHLGAYLADLINHHDPGIVILGGGLGAGVPEYRDAAFTLARELIGPPQLKDIPLSVATLGPDAPWIGAAHYAVDDAQGASHHPPARPEQLRPPHSTIPIGDVA